MPIAKTKTHTHVGLNNIKLMHIQVNNVVENF